MLWPVVHLAVLRSLVSPVFNKEPKFGRRVDTRNNPLDWFTQYLIIETCMAKFLEGSYR